MTRSIPTDATVPVATVPILVVGESLVDIVEDSGQTHRHVGGSSLNVAVGLGRLGDTVRLLTAFGTDADGAVVMSHLDRSGVVVDSESVISGTTSTAMARLGSDGAAEYVFDVRWELPSHAAPAAVAIAHAGSLGSALDPGRDAVRAVIERMRPTTVITFDPNIRPALMGTRTEQVAITEQFFALADVVKMSHEDAEWLYPDRGIDDVIDHMLSFGASLVVITRSSDGSVLASAAARIVVPTKAQDVVDTIGAGDSYMAGIIHLVASLLESGERLDQIRSGEPFTAELLEAIGDFATECAAVTVRRSGADLPWSHEVAAATVSVR